MTKVMELMPGNEVDMGPLGGVAIFVARTGHPIWPHLELVVWKLPDGTWSHDALDARQDVGQVKPWAEPIDRLRNLRFALLNESQQSAEHIPQTLDVVAPDLAAEDAWDVAGDPP